MNRNETECHDELKVTSWLPRLQTLLKKLRKTRTHTHAQSSECVHLLEAGIPGGVVARHGVVVSGGPVQVTRRVGGPAARFPGAARPGAGHVAQGAAAAGRQRGRAPGGPGPARPPLKGLALAPQGQWKHLGRGRR